MCVFFNSGFYNVVRVVLTSAVLVGNGITLSIAQEQKVLTNTKIFKLDLGASRVIYNLGSSGTFLSINNNQNYPILVQGKVYSEDKKTTAPFIVTPPVFRLDAQQQSRMKIIRTGGHFFDNRETLQWLCVGGIPPKDTDVWAQDKHGKSAPPSAVTLNMQVSSTSCIKLLMRPPGLEETMIEAASALKWQRQGDKMTVTNSSAFYINFSSLSVGGFKIADPEYISPFSSRSFPIPRGAAGKVTWVVITDEGGASRPFQVSL